MAPIIIVALLALVVGPAFQDKPDFSGRWVLESASQSAREIPHALSVRQTLVRKNVFGQPMAPYFKDITIERQFQSGNRVDTFLIGVVGGVVPGLNPDGTRGMPYTHFEVRWDGDALVIETGRSTEQARRSGEWEEHQEVWSLDSDGRLRVAMTTVTSARASNTETLVYRRR